MEIFLLILKFLLSKFMFRNIVLSVWCLLTSVSVESQKNVSREGPRCRFYICVHVNTSYMND